MVEFFVAASLIALAASAFVALVSGLSRVMTRRYEASSYREVVGFNPPAALMTLYGRAWPYACRAMIVSGAAAVLALLIWAVI
jgi:hypothetical protein